jgi:release factor glutamine methyltransferase
VTSTKAQLTSELRDMGLPTREARWLVEEFAIGEDLDAREAVIHAASRRLSGEPLQYVIGHWPFRSLDLDVDERVLIPRPESEELVSIALSELATHDVSAPIIVDLGCGSGAIGFALLLELAERGVHGALFCVDVSLDALSVARRNAIKHRLNAVSFVRSSWFEDLDESLRGRVDLIVANPPYVGAREFETLDDVLRHEPYGALVSADADGVEGFSDVAHIVAEAPGWLSRRGELIVEHGQAHGAAARRAAQDAGFGALRTQRDLAGHERFLVAGHGS